MSNLIGFKHVWIVSNARKEFRIVRYHILHRLDGPIFTISNNGISYNFCLRLEAPNNYHGFIDNFAVALRLTDNPALPNEIELMREFFVLKPVYGTVAESFPADGLRKLRFD